MRCWMGLRDAQLMKLDGMGDGNRKAERSLQWERGRGEEFHRRNAQTCWTLPLRPGRGGPARSSTRPARTSRAAPRHTCPRSSAPGACTRFGLRRTGSGAGYELAVSRRLLLLLISLPGAPALLRTEPPSPPSPCNATHAQSPPVPPPPRTWAGPVEQRVAPAADNGVLGVEGGLVVGAVVAARDEQVGLLLGRGRRWGEGCGVESLEANREGLRGSGVGESRRGHEV